MMKALVLMSTNYQSLCTLSTSFDYALDNIRRNQEEARTPVLKN